MESCIGLVFSFFAAPSTAVSCIYRPLGRWALIYAPAERPPERYGDVKWRSCDRNPDFYWPVGRPFVSLSPSPRLRQFRVYSGPAFGVGF